MSFVTCATGTLKKLTPFRTKMSRLVFYISHVQRLLTSLQMSTKNQMCLNDVLIVTLVSPHFKFRFKFAFVSFFAL